MNLRKRKQRLIMMIMLGLLCFIGGFYLVGIIGVNGMNIPSKYSESTNETYYLVSTSFQPAVIFMAAGCFFLMLSNMFFFVVIAVLRHGKYERFRPFTWSRLPFIALFTLNLNFFTSSYFADMAKFYLKKKKAEVYLQRYEIFNSLLSEIFFVILVLVLLYNTGRKKQKWFSLVVSLLAVVQSFVGLISRTFTVTWLWMVYGAALLICIAFVFVCGAVRTYGVAAVKSEAEAVYNIAYFVSPHGYGHLMRTIPVIEEILKSGKGKVLLVSAASHLEAGKHYLERYSGLSRDVLDERFFTEEMTTDFGLAVESGSLKLDVGRVRAGIEGFTNMFPAYINAGEKLVEKYEITRIVSDICPWALLLAEKCEIPSIFMASFTWLEIYQEYYSDELIAPIRACYNLADKVLFYELVNKPTKARFPYGKQLGYVCRPIHQETVREIKEKYSEGRGIVYFTVGLSNDGIDAQIDVSGLPYTFITTSGVGLIGSNVHHIEGISDHAQDYVAAASYCIIKSGWTTISECMIAGVPMALIGRDDVAEDRMSIEMLEELGCGIKVAPEELEDLAGVMKRLEEHEWRIYPHENESKAFAEEVLSWQE